MSQPLRYAIVFVVLLALLAATVGIAFLDLARFGHFAPLALALGIAGVKALLIGLYFMHLRGSPPRVAMFAAAGFVFLAILATLTFADYLTRDAPAAIVSTRQ